MAEGLVHYQRSEALNRWWVILPALVAILLAPTLAHRNVFVFWDTAPYYEYGQKLTQAVVGAFSSSDGAEDATTTQDAVRQLDGAFTATRSPFFSVLVYGLSNALSNALGLWLLPLTQAIATAWLIWRVAHHVAARDAFRIAVALTTIATFGSSAWYFMGFVMPDAYAAIGLLSLALLFAFGHRMGWPERVTAGLLVYVAVLFHGSHGPTIAVAMAAGCVALFLLSSDARRWRLPSAVALCAVIGAAASQFATNAAIEWQLGISPKSPPFLTARILADGHGRRFLAEECQREKTFLLCDYRERTYQTADGFLWSRDPLIGVYHTVPPEKRLQIIAEEPGFAAAVVMAYPLSVLSAALHNTVTQLFLIAPDEAWIDPGLQFGDPGMRDVQLFEVATFLNDCIADLGSCVPSVPQIVVAVITYVTAAASLLIIVWNLGNALSNRTRLSPSAQSACVFAIVILAGVVANAIVCGAVSGPHPRYASRVVWLLIIAAGVLELIRPYVFGDASVKGSPAARLRGLLRSGRV